MSSGFYAEVGSVRRGIENLEAHMNKALTSVCKETSKEMERYAKEHAPWQDRTGNARAGLTGSYGANQYVHWIKLGHSVDYGVYLELSNEKRFEIIHPTMRRFQSTLARRIKEELGS